MITLLFVLSVGILEGVFIAVVFSFALVVHHLSKAPSVVIAQYPETLVINVGPGIFFANAPTIRDNIREIIASNSSEVKYVFIDASTFINIDIAAAEMLEEFQEELNSKGIMLGLLGTKEPVMTLLIKTGLAKKLLLRSTLHP